MGQQPGPACAERLCQGAWSGRGKRAEMTVEGGALVVKVVKPRKRRRQRLESLIERITTENCHPETGVGAAVGNEIR